MDEKEFQDRLDRHGGDIDAWPDEARARAAALLARSAAAQAMLARHRRFERLLEPGPVPEPPSVAQIMARATAPRRAAGFRLEALWPVGFRLFGTPQLAGLAACLLIGFVAGLAPAFHRDASAELYDFIDSPGQEPGDE